MTVKGMIGARLDEIRAEGSVLRAEFNALGDERIPFVSCGILALACAAWGLALLWTWVALALCFFALTILTP